MTIETKVLTEGEKQEYINHPYICPYCGEDDIFANHFLPEGNYCNVECNACGREWREVFELVGIEEIK